MFNKNIFNGCLSKLISNKNKFKVAAVTFSAVFAYLSFNNFADIVPEQPQGNNGIYQISTPGELVGFANLVNTGFVNGINNTDGGDGFPEVNASAVLISDIDLNDATINSNTINSYNDLNVCTPIGNEGGHYRGTFNGKGHEIRGLYINSNGDYHGLFGYIGIGGVVKNIKISNSYIKGRRNVGAIAGINRGVITDSCNLGDVFGSGAYIGGIAGENLSVITKSFNEGCVRGGEVIGGIVGMNGDKGIDYCYNKGSVTGSHQVGGIAGCHFKGYVKNCYDKGVVSGNSGVGQIIGLIERRDVISRVTVNNCYYLDEPDIVGIGRGNEFGGTTAKTAQEFIMNDENGVCALLNEGETEPFVLNNDASDSPILIHGIDI